MAAVAVGVLVAMTACTGDDAQSVSTGAGDEAVPPSTAVPLSSTEWTDLPRSPLGEWGVYHWAWLVDGSGFVQAGAAEGGSAIARTSEVVAFSFDTMKYTAAPDLPTEGGLGAAGAAWVGERLVLIGQDCPAGVGPSFIGQAVCVDGTTGRRVSATWKPGEESWTVVDLPDWIREFDQGAPTLIGVLDGKVLMASGDRPAHVGAFDPATGSWTRLPDAPEVPLGDVGAEAAAMSFAAYSATVCVVGGELIAFAFGSDLLLLDGVPRDSSPNRWWRFDGASWVDIPSPVTGLIDRAMCGSTGVYVSLWNSTSTSRLVYAEPGSGSDPRPLGEPAPRSFVGPNRLPGDAALMARYGPDDLTTQPMFVATPDALVPVAVPDATDALLVGRTLVKTGDLMFGEGTRTTPRIAAAIGR